MAAHIMLLLPENTAEGGQASSCSMPMKKGAQFHHGSFTKSFLHQHHSLLGKAAATRNPEEMPAMERENTQN